MSAASARRGRCSIRLKGYDYSQPGAYFITLVTHGRECLFGDLVDGVMRLNGCGETAASCWLAIPDHFPHVELDQFVVMPNHLHGIIAITDITDAPVGGVGARHASPQPGQPIGVIVGSYKSAVARRINQQRCSPGAAVWQRNYYEHVIRTEPSLNRVRQYISDNPTRWSNDRENPQKDAR